MSRAVRDSYSLLTSKQKQKLRDEEKALNNTCRKEQLISHRGLNHRHSL